MERRGGVARVRTNGPWTDLTIRKVHADLNSDLGHLGQHMFRGNFAQSGIVSSLKA